MILLRRFGNHRPDAKKYIPRVSRFDSGIISSMAYCDLLRTPMTTGTNRPIRVATFVHDAQAVALNDSAMEYFDRDPTMAIARPSGILVLQQTWPCAQGENEVATRNPHRVLWVRVRRSRGLVIARKAVCNHAMLSVSESNLAAVLTALVSIVARRRSRPIRNCTGLFASTIGGLGSRSPGRILFGLRKKKL